MDNYHMERLMQRLKDRLNSGNLPPGLYRFFKDLLNDAEGARISYDQFISQLQLEAYRNPQFPGDEMGYWDDDRDDDKDDTDEKSDDDTKS